MLHQAMVVAVESERDGCLIEPVTDEFGIRDRVQCGADMVELMEAFEAY